MANRKIVVALGGNAILSSDPSAKAQQEALVETAKHLVQLIKNGDDLIITHGNGPQVGLLALQGAAYKDVPTYPLDVLGAESVGMIGYMIQQELGNLVPFEVPFATLLSQVEVDINDPAFKNPTKPIGPVYSKEEAERLAKEKNWSIAQDGDKYRRVVPSPLPKRIFEIRPVKWLLEKGSIVICAGGGGVPVVRNDNGFTGVEAVNDKDFTASVLAKDVQADRLIILTGVDNIYINYNQPNQQALGEISVAQAKGYIEEGHFAAGSMLPKIEAAIDFVEEDAARTAIITSIEKLAELDQHTGTILRK